MEADDLIPISALQHVVFCPRRAALIHVERAWAEDGATARGHVVHERVDTPGVDHRAGVRVVRALQLKSERLGVVGVADMVELAADASAPRGVRPRPVEVKSGRTNRLLADHVQLCAQAICLEEVYGVPVPDGAVFHAASKRRTLVELSPPLRSRTERAVAEMREIFSQGRLPRPVEDEKKCRGCSLLELCMPHAARASERSVSHRRSLALLDPVNR